MLKGNWLHMKFGEIFWGEVKIDASKGGEGYKQKGNDYTIFSLSNSLSHKWLLQMSNQYRMFKCIICQIDLFDTVIILSTLFFCLFQLFSYLYFQGEFHKGRKYELRQ